MARSRKGLGQRQLILDTALALLGEEGFDRTSLSRIARRAGLTTSGVMHYFSSKSELFISVLGLRKDQWRSTPQTADGYLSSFVAAAAENARTPGLIQLFQHMVLQGATGDSEAKTFIEAHYRDARKGLEQQIEALQVNGHMPATVPASILARGIIALSDGLQLQWMYEQDLDLGSLYGDLVRALLDTDRIPTDLPASHSVG